MTGDNKENQATAFYAKQKDDAGKFATFAWIAVGIWLIYRNPDATFLSWQAAVYFVIGMFLAAIVFGLVAHFLQRAIAKMVVFSGAEPGVVGGVSLSVLGLVLMVGEAVVIYFAAKYVLYDLLY